MATFKSTQVTNYTAKPAVYTKTQEWKGRLRVGYWSYTTPASAAPLINDVIQLVALPKNARIVMFEAVWEAMGAGAQMDFGLSSSGDAARYIALQDVNGVLFVRPNPLLDKLPESVLITQAADPPPSDYTFFQVTVKGANLAVSKKFQGNVTWVLD